MPPLSGFQRLCILTCILIFGLIILGGVVRATDSGLGCPDWPRCHGSFIPKMEKHTLIEYSHRLTASVAGLMVFGIAAWAVRSYRRVPAILYPSLAAFVLILIQGGLGGIAVLNELPPEVIMVHLGLALTILTLIMLIAMTSISMSGGLARFNAPPGLGRVAITAAAATLVLMLVGSYVSGAGYGLACSGWPLCNGEVVPGDAPASVQVHFMHRLLALVTGLSLLLLVFVAWRARNAAPLMLTFSVAALAVYGVQAMIGAANIWTQLADGVSASHLAFATLLWLILAMLNILVLRIHERLPRSVQPSATGDLAGAMR